MYQVYETLERCGGDMAAFSRSEPVSADTDITLQEAIALLERLRDEYDLFVQSSEWSAADTTLRHILSMCDIIDARTTRSAEAADSNPYRAGRAASG